MQKYFATASSLCYDKENVFEGMLHVLKIKGEYYVSGYHCALRQQCIRAEILFNELWCNGDRKLFPETIEVLEYFKSKGYKMGVISDTSPSLEYTL